MTNELNSEQYTATLRKQLATMELAAVTVAAILESAGAHELDHSGDLHKWAEDIARTARNYMVNSYGELSIPEYENICGQCGNRWPSEGDWTAQAAKCANCALLDAQSKAMGGDDVIVHPDLPDGWEIRKRENMLDGEGNIEAWATKKYHVLDGRTDARGQGDTIEEAMRDAGLPR